MDSKTAIEEGVALFQRLADGNPGLRSELAASASTFFPPSGPSSVHASYAERRQLEWFLFERPSESLDGVPAERLMDAWYDAAPDALQDYASALLNSLAGIFKITSIEPGRGVWLHDLLGLGEYPVEEPDAAAAMETGDLIVGRVFPIGDSLFRLSPAAGCFHDANLVTALERDMQRLRSGRRGSLRIQQTELERMFFSIETTLSGIAEGPTPAEQVAQARIELEALGLDEGIVVACFEHLASMPVEAIDPLLGAGDALADLLEELAFETDVDLEAARRLLLAAWPALYKLEHEPEPDVGASNDRPGASARSTRTGTAASGAPAPEARPKATEAEATLEPVASPEQVRRALAEFDAARGQGADIESSFADLERSLGLTASADDAASHVPDFPGVVAAMIAEFRWQTRGDEPQLSSDDPLALLAEYGSDVGVFENLRARDLLAFAGLWCLEEERLPSPEFAAALLDALRDFCSWCDSEHELELWSEFAPTWEGLRESLPRVLAANLELGALGRTASGQVFELQEGSAATGELRLLTAQGSAALGHVTQAAAAHLQPGDLIRAAAAPAPEEALAEPRVAAQRCYPPEADALLRQGTV